MKWGKIPYIHVSSLRVDCTQSYFCSFRRTQKTIAKELALRAVSFDFFRVENR